MLELATVIMFHAAEKVVMLFICVVVLTIPPPEVVCPLVSVSQKELLAVLPVCLISLLKTYNRGPLPGGSHHYCQSVPD